MEAVWGSARWDVWAIDLGAWQVSRSRAYGPAQETAPTGCQRDREDTYGAREYCCLTMKCVSGQAYVGTTRSAIFWLGVIDRFWTAWTLAKAIGSENQHHSKSDHAYEEQRDHSALQLETTGIPMKRPNNNSSSLSMTCCRSIVPRNSRRSENFR
jgi:hypothetical protein